MEIASIGAQAAVPPQGLRASEAAERVPDNEAAEQAAPKAAQAKAPLPADVGTIIDTQA